MITALHGEVLRMARNENSLWMVVHMAHGTQRADYVEALLQAEGFLVKRRQLDRSVSETDGACELLVLKSEAQEAREFLLEKGF